jgi:Mitochondrial carrier protein
MSTQGYRGLVRGVEVAVIRAFPANAALFMGYEISRKGLDRVIY